jgi:hypothetical protein
MSGVTTTLKLNKLAGNLAQMDAADRHAAQDANLDAIDAFAARAGVFSEMVFQSGVGTDGMILYRNALPQKALFPAGAASSSAIAGTAATGSTVYSFKKNGVQFATATFAISGTTATWTQASDATFNAGDVLEIDGPVTADATLADVGITLVGVKQ